MMMDSSVDENTMADGTATIKQPPHVQLLE